MKTCFSIIRITMILYLSFVVGKTEDDCTSGYMLNQTIKQCIPCLSGYLGENCKIECPSPYYGWKCMNKCNCDNQECHHVNGCRLQADQNNNFNITTTPERRNHTLCLVNYKWSFAEQRCIHCDPGYFGINCDTKCPRLSYGFNCLLKCECSEHDCHHVNGCTQTSRDSESQLHQPVTQIHVRRNTHDSMESHLHQLDKETTRYVDEVVVDIENQGMEAGHKDTENNSESTAKKEPARIGIILLTIVSVVIILLIICTYPLEKYQITKYRQKEDLFNI